MVRVDTQVTVNTVTLTPGQNTLIPKETYEMLCKLPGICVQNIPWYPVSV